MTLPSLNLMAAQSTGAPQEKPPALSPRANATERIGKLKQSSPRKVLVRDSEKRAEAKKERAEEKMAAEREQKIAETLHNAEIGALVVEEVTIESTEVVSSPRGAFNQTREIFERGLSSEMEPQTAKTTIEKNETVSHEEFRRRLNIFGQPSSPKIPTSPRREALANLPPLTPTEPEKKT